MKPTLLFRALAALLATAGALAAAPSMAQLRIPMPASAVDDGTRAVIAIDLQPLRDGIDGAMGAAGAAGAAAAAAQAGADGARGAAGEALLLAGEGSLTTQPMVAVATRFVAPPGYPAGYRPPGSPTNTSEFGMYGACVRGMGSNSVPSILQAWGRAWNVQLSGDYAVQCPAGSGFVAWSVVQPGQGDGGSDGNGTSGDGSAGGASGGSSAGG